MCTPTIDCILCGCNRNPQINICIRIQLRDWMSMEMDDVLLGKINRLHLNIRVCRTIQVKWWLLSRSHRNCSISKSLNKFKQDYFSPPISLQLIIKAIKSFYGKKIAKMFSFSFLLNVWTRRHVYCIRFLSRLFFKLDRTFGRVYWSHGIAFHYQHHIPYHIIW